MVLPDLLPDRPRQPSVIAGVESHAVVAAHDPHFREVSRVLDRQAAQPNGIEQLKDRRVRSNAERKRYYGHDCKAGSAAKLAQAVAYVLQQRLEAIPSPHVPAPLSQLHMEPHLFLQIARTASRSFLHFAPARSSA